MRRSLAAPLAAGVYVLWVASTFFFEGRVHLLERYDPAGRTRYALLANVLVGTVVALGAVHVSRLGGASARVAKHAWTRPLVVLFTIVLGAAFVALVAPSPARDPIVLINAFAQVLPTSIAEVAVCWMLVGAAARVRIAGAASVLVPIVVADVAFAVYHVAHSPPFDQPRMMLFLAIPGLVVGVLVYVARSAYAAVLAQNFFAVVGMAKNLDPGAFRHPFVWAYATAALALLVFALMLAPRVAAWVGAFATRSPWPARRIP